MKINEFYFIEKFIKPSFIYFIYKQFLFLNYIDLLHENCSNFDKVRSQKSSKKLKSESAKFTTLTKQFLNFVLQRKASQSN